MIIERFQELNARFMHVPRGRGHEKAKHEFALAQIELFNLAQAICYTKAPEVQHLLDQARRSFMQEVKEKLETKAGMLVVRKARTAFWYDFLISPEVSNDISLQGITVSNATCYQLESAHSAQIRVVRQGIL